MHPGPLGLDELGSDNDGEVSIKSLKEDDQINVDNPNHDEPPPVGGLDVLLVVTPIVGNKTLLIAM